MNAYNKWKDKNYFPVDYNYIKNISEGFFTRKGKLSKIEQELFPNDKEWEDVRSLLNTRRRLLSTKMLFESIAVFSIVLGGYKFALAKYFSRNKTKYVLVFSFILSYLKYNRSIYSHVDISDIVNIHSNFGVYLWYESRFRDIYSLQDSSFLNALDEEFESEYETTLNNKIISKEKIERILFYYDLKLHFIKMYLNSEVLLKEYPVSFLLRFLNWRYYSYRKHSLVNKINKELHKILSEDNTDSTRKEYPLITPNNLSHYFNETELEYLVNQEKLRKTILYNSKI